MYSVYIRWSFLFVCFFSVQRTGVPQLCRSRRLPLSRSRIACGERGSCLARSGPASVRPASSWPVHSASEPRHSPSHFPVYVNGTKEGIFNFSSVKFKYFSPAVYFLQLPVLSTLRPPDVTLSSSRGPRRHIMPLATGNFRHRYMTQI